MKINKTFISKLSECQINVLEKMCEYGDLYKLSEEDSWTDYPRSFNYFNWSYEGHKQFEWGCTARTLKSLAKKELVSLDEENGICKLIIDKHIVSNEILDVWYDFN